MTDRKKDEFDQYYESICHGPVYDNGLIPVTAQVAEQQRRMILEQQRVAEEAASRYIRTSEPSVDYTRHLEHMIMQMNKIDDRLQSLDETLKKLVLAVEKVSGW